MYKNSLASARLTLFIFLLTTAAVAWAHEESRAKIQLFENNQLSIGIPASVAGEQLRLDYNNDQKLQWSEIDTASELIQAHYSKQLEISNPQGRCTSEWRSPLRLTPYKNEYRIVMQFALNCPNNEAATSIKSDFATIDYSILESSQQKGARLLINQQSLNLGEPVSWLQLAVEFLYQGIVHIVIGYDHILFLFGLMLSVSATQKATQGIPLKRYLVLITSFTVAHSITLIAASLNWLLLPIHWAEFIIAGSVLFAAMAHYSKWITRRLAIFCFAFGLIHGFGFASVLGDLISQQDERLLPLLSFNIGVEIGQIVIAIIAMLPLALIARTAKPQLFYHGATAVLAITASIWLLDRWPTGL